MGLRGLCVVGIVFCLNQDFQDCFSSRLLFKCLGIVYECTICSVILDNAPKVQVCVKFWLQDA